MVTKIYLAQRLYEELIQFAQLEAPRECCGLLGGVGQEMKTLYPLQNVAQHPETNYNAAPTDLFTVTKRIRQRGESLLAIFHSHPRSPAWPSATDIELAYYPDAFYLIIALTPQPALRGFRIRNQQVTEIEIVITTDNLG
ncbi:MAG: M67 family metallopeptidase [Acidobacteria bacterium]|nr:M67 family metallopeptidase [Acidobacteriota bacterium]